MEVIGYTLLFALGTAGGSFLNVLTLRYDPEKRFLSKAVFGGRSRCVHCARTLRWFELIPLISFLMLRGRCRTCHVRLSFQYPGIEIVGGAAFIGVVMALNSFYNISFSAFVTGSAPLLHYAIVVLWFCVALALIAITVIDIRHYIIPDELNILIAVLGVGAAILVEYRMPTLLPFRTSFVAHYELLFFPITTILLNRLAGALVGGAIFGALAFGSRGRAMGFGDVKFAVALGILFGWPDIGLITILSFILGGIWGAVLLIFRAKGMRDRIPFGPFIVLGALLTLTFGYTLIDGYLSLFKQ